MKNKLGSVKRQPEINPSINRNSGSPPIALVPKDKADRQPIGLNQDEISQVAKLEYNIKESVSALGELQFKLMKAEAQRASLANKINVLQEQLHTVITELATKNGIDVNNPENGKWHFSSDTMTFTPTT